VTGRVVTGRALTLVLGVAIAALAGCGDGPEPQTTDAQSAGQPERLGCGEYCQQAGLIGDGASGRPALSIDTGSPVEALPDDTIPITTTCLLPVSCEGALLLYSYELGRYGDSAGRSDLVVEPNSPRTIAVPLVGAARKALHAHGRLEIAVTADLLPTVNTLPKGERGNWKPIILKDLVALGSAPAAP
jgi:hypothetical protein